MTRIGARDDEHEKTIDTRLSFLARDVASCALVNAGMFRAMIPGDRKQPEFVNGEFTIDLYENTQMVAQVVVRDLRESPLSTSRQSRITSRGIL